MLPCNHMRNYQHAYHLFALLTLPVTVNGVTPTSCHVTHSFDGQHGVARSHKDRYGAWAGMATLEQKNLVRRNRSGRKPTFSLTETGRELAQRIVEASYYLLGTDGVFLDLLLLGITVQLLVFRTVKTYR